METKLQTDYGNWVPRKLLAFLTVITVLTTALLSLSICLSWGWLPTAIVAILTCICIAVLTYFSIVYRTFSPRGGAFMAKVHDYVASRLPWGGHGELLDVGCGAGALTIRCALKFPQSRCTGIDYWGVKWDYSKRMCQKNAEAEGVKDRCCFMHGDANNLDFADETFDAVVSNFVYHEVNDGKSKEQLLRETLRVLKKGGVFALQDLFGQRSVYGDFQQICDNLKSDCVSELHYSDSCRDIPVPKWMQVTGLLTGVGIIYGRK